ncbi:MAG: VanZ family protein [Acidobacteriota bacterium]
MKLAKKRREQLMLYAPLLVWIGVIFFLSSGQGASTRTSLIIRPLLEFLFPAALPETITLYHGIIRKFAHFAEYAVLGFLACRAFSASHQNLIRKFSFLSAIVLILAVAGSDEINQSFNPARTASPFDVLLDLSGGLAATIFHYLLTRHRARTAVSVV